MACYLWCVKGLAVLEVEYVEELLGVYGSGEGEKCLR